MRDMEKEANVFALLLLMPRQLIMQEFLKLGAIDLTDDKALKGICERFGVTRTALVARLSMLSYSDKKKIGL